MPLFFVTMYVRNYPIQPLYHVKHINFDIDSDGHLRLTVIAE